MNSEATGVISPLMDLKEAARFLGTPVYTVRQMVYAGTLAYQKLGKRFVVKRAEVEAVISRGWRRNGK